MERAFQSILGLVAMLAGGSVLAQGLECDRACLAERFDDGNFPLPAYQNAR